MNEDICRNCGNYDRLADHCDFCYQEFLNCESCNQLLDKEEFLCILIGDSSFHFHDHKCKTSFINEHGYDFSDVLKEAWSKKLKEVEKE